MPVPHGLIGVVHLQALPGDPGWDGATMTQVLDAAARDAQALAAGGARAVIVENFGSWPFPKGTADQASTPFTVAALTLAAERCRKASGLPIGVNVLRNDAAAAMSIAAAVGASFIRVNVHIGASVTDQGVIEGQAWHTLRLRRQLEAPGISVLADVRVKHARPLVERPLAEEVADLVQRGGAQAVIVTGSGTGQPVDPHTLLSVRQATDGPVLIGSGLTPDNATTLAPHASGAIVGTWLKRGGQVRQPVDVERVQRLVDAVAPWWGPSTAVA